MREGWQEKYLGEVCEMIKRGISPKYTEGVGICVINQKCIRNHEINLSVSRLHDNNLKQVNPERLIRLGDVLVNSTGTGTLGRVAQVRKIQNIDCTVDTHVTIVRPLPDLFFKDFFGYALIKIEEEITKSGEGASGQTELARTKLQNDFKISFPKSLTEQKQIVKILDQVFEGIDQAKINIEKNIENAKELFQSKLNEIFSQKGEGWEEKKLEKLSIIKSGGTPSRSKKEYWDESSIAWYSSGELNELFTKDPKRYITIEGLENSNAKVFPQGSLLIGMYDTAALKMSIIDRDASFNQAICGIEPNKDINLIFILHAINSIKPEILKLRRGVRQKNLNQKKIKEIRISIPKIEIQNAIVKKLELYQQKTQSLNSINIQKLNNLEELKKSVLQKAFAGELTGKELPVEVD